MASNHTPGPWLVEADMRQHYESHKRECTGPEYLAGWNITSDAGEIVGTEGIIPSDTAEANARLIAEAPAMLEALQDALMASDANDGDSLMNALAAFRAILTRIDGKA